MLGGGVVGEAAALMAAGLGADVTIADISLPRLRQLDIETPANVHTLYSSEHNIRSMLPAVDIVVGSVLVPGDKTPHLITKEMLKLMEPGTVLAIRPLIVIPFIQKRVSYTIVWQISLELFQILQRWH